MLLLMYVCMYRWVNLFNAHVFITPKFDRFQRVMGGESVFEESKVTTLPQPHPSFITNPNNHITLTLTLTEPLPSLQPQPTTIITTN